MMKFGFPRTLIAETQHWAVLARPQQPTLGSLVMACREPATAFGDLSAAAYDDLRVVVAGGERMLKTFVDYARINYLMLMMVDPHVHFHVIPRYEGSRTYRGVAFADTAWPGPPALAPATTPPADVLEALTADMKALWR